MLPRSERHDDDDEDYHDHNEDYHDHNQDYDYDYHEGDEGDCKDNSAAKIRKTCEEEYDDDHIHNEDYHFHNEDCDDGDKDDCKDNLLPTSERHVKKRRNIMLMV